MKNKKLQCENCTHWSRQQDTDFYTDMGKCAKLSAQKGEEYPDTEKTGIESIPICSHDGGGSEYMTKNWFNCLHYDYEKEN